MNCLPHLRSALQRKEFKTEKKNIDSFSKKLLKVIRREHIYIERSIFRIERLTSCRVVSTRIRQAAPPIEDGASHLFKPSLYRNNNPLDINSYVIFAAVLLPYILKKMSDSSVPLTTWSD